MSGWFGNHFIATSITLLDSFNFDYSNSVFIYHNLINRMTSYQATHSIFIKTIQVLTNQFFLVACYATLHPALSVCPSIGLSVRPSVHHTLLFWRFWGFWPHCSGPNAPLTSNMAPDHPHATGLAVYSALFVLFSVLAITDETCQSLKICQSGMYMNGAVKTFQIQISCTNIINFFFFMYMHTSIYVRKYPI